MKNYLISLLSLGIIFSFVELKTNKNCKKDYNISKLNNCFFIFSLTFHYFLYFFIYLTVFFVILPNYFSDWFKLAYIIFLILVLSSWLLFDNKCIITVLTNKANNMPEDSAFRDPFEILTNSYTKVPSLKNKLTFRDKLYYFFVIASILVSIFTLLSKSIKIYKNK